MDRIGHHWSKIFRSYNIQWYIGINMWDKYQAKEKSFDLNTAFIYTEHVNIWSAGALDARAAHLYNLAN